ncbi:MAG: EscU/YscU/HrcU family type III secretion system export apparatus switch protein [Stenotrophomonas acidaminiphila]|uniref:EscU/YscU/HrcU family type III secretion system export apparatus switch protein n=1 Tax=Stenotrophomonas acidaminiphila TaxID=128780 RepID=UPI00095A56F0|nr:EscU/YscU/HrcU family type III secretion system export apparatus switch protein [Stenotrophomonas acidaminiphila]MBN8800767.1 EscU/YscU/HrcU family type III secretion system export apparatus switch protein [Stenotrophomonas acidaminiphila]MDF9442303.1 EscU/YscU/HrcU family type III secretion system export apparatus switch protein [Stenotrophomonas acidaminiphila]OJY80438.1 MAG: flagellar biosynthesis protein FlhB [Stenotrophomonas sp. 69-14]
MAEGDQDKTEKPTQHRMEQARRQGQVAKSPDLVGVSSLLVFVLAFVALASGLATAMAVQMRQMIAMAGARPHMGSGFAAWLGQLLGKLGPQLIPLVLAMVVVAIAANVLQTGPVFSTHPVKPDFKRMHPGNAVKRLFSMRGVWELGKLLIKLGLLAALCWMAVRIAPEFVLRVIQTPSSRLPELLLGTAWKTSLYVIAILALVALADLLFVRRNHVSQLRMSRRELKDENKQRDGDPDVKARQKRSIRELLKKTKAIQRVGDADVVLTNPTHYAVALQYRPSTMRAPIVLAKGRGFLAARVRQVALRRGVAVIAAPPLARALYRLCEIDAPVPESLYGQLGPIYRRLYAMKGVA